MSTVPEVTAQPTPFLDKAGTLIFNIRQPLTLINLLFWAVIISYCGWFVQEVFSFWIALYNDPPHQFGVGQFHPHFLLHNGEDFILWALRLIDASMVANLVVMMAVGNQSTFVKEFDARALAGKPRWMNRLDSNTLKIKMAMSMVGITSVLILRTAMECGSRLDEMLRHNEYDLHAIVLMGSNITIQVVVHTVFIATAYWLTAVSKAMHGHEPAPSSVNPDPSGAHH